MAAWLPAAAAQEFPAQPQAQQEGQEAQQLPPPPPAASTLATVHGIVKNAATGEPLPRVLVRIEGDASSGALTDGDGRFEIPGVPVGPQVFQVVKPGFRDQPSYAGRPLERSMSTMNNDHNCLVAAEMPDLVFIMTPNNSIRGQIQLSTGDPAQGVGVMLLARTVQDGRVVWHTSINTRTNSEGVYRFGGLADGVYAAYTEPAMDSEEAGDLVPAGNDRAVARNGYASVFYPEARDLAGAAKIELSGGEQAQANFLLSLESFHMVRARVATGSDGQTSAANKDETTYTAQVMDAQGHSLPYPAQYDPAKHSVQASLPDGTYSLLVTAVTPYVVVKNGPARFSLTNAPGPGPLAGQAEFTVAGQAVTNLRIPLVPQRGNPVQVSMFKTGAQRSPAGAVQEEGIYITLSQAGGGVTDGMVSTFSQGPVTGPLETGFMAPGLYWVHTTVAQRGYCQASFTAGGASLAREPLVLGISGATAPMTLTLRDDCASLKLSLPFAGAFAGVGEERYYIVYVVPDFDSTADVTPVTLRPTSGGMVTLDNLTPGDYHVYTFTGPVDLEYRNPEALAGLPGQAVTVSPGAANSLVLEVPEQ